MRPPFLRTIREAARELGVQRRLLRELIEIGQLPVFREGDRVYVDPMVARGVIDRRR